MILVIVLRTEIYIYILKVSLLGYVPCKYYYKLIYDEEWKAGKISHKEKNILICNGI